MSMESPQITVIVLAYHSGDYLLETLDSVIQQTYPNIQLIVSDDGTPGFNMDPIKAYIEATRCERLTSVVYNVNEHNLGTVRHVETLLPKCTGDYVCMIGADDAYYDAAVFADVAEEFSRLGSGCGVVVTNLSMCDEHLKNEHYTYISEETCRHINGPDGAYWLFAELAYRCLLPAAGTFYRREVLLSAGNLSSCYDLVEDWPTHIRLARQGVRFFCMDRIGCKHRFGGVSHNDDCVTKTIVRICGDRSRVYLTEVLPYLGMLRSDEQSRAVFYGEFRNSAYEKAQRQFKLNQQWPRIYARLGAAGDQEQQALELPPGGVPEYLWLLACDCDRKFLEVSLAQRMAELSGRYILYIGCSSTQRGKEWLVPFLNAHRNEMTVRCVVYEQDAKHGESAEAFGARLKRLHPHAQAEELAVRKLESRKHGSVRALLTPLLACLPVFISDEVCRLLGCPLSAVWRWGLYAVGCFLLLIFIMESCLWFRRLLRAAPGGKGA